MTIKIWNSTSGTVLKSFVIATGYSAYLRALGVFANGDIIAGNTNGLYLFDSNLLLKANNTNLNFVDSILVFSNGNFVVESMSKISIFDGPALNELISAPKSAVILTFLELPNGEFASGDVVSTITIRYSNLTIKKNLTGHSSGIDALTQLPNGDLVSGSWDKTIKIWDLNTGLVKKTLNGNSGAIYGLIALSNNLVISGSCDAPIKIWDLNSELVNKTFTSPTNCMSNMRNFLPGKFITSGETSIYIWSL